MREGSRRGRLALLAPIAAALATGLPGCSLGGAHPAQTVSSASITVASSARASSSVVVSIFLMPVTMVCIESWVVISSGHRY